MLKSQVVLKENQDYDIDNNKLKIHNKNFQNLTIKMSILKFTFRSQMKIWMGSDSKDFL